MALKNRGREGGEGLSKSLICMAGKSGGDGGEGSAKSLKCKRRSAESKHPRTPKCAGERMALARRTCTSGQGRPPPGRNPGHWGRDRARSRVRSAAT